jgi:hypothetical protein
MEGLIILGSMGVCTAFAFVIYFKIENRKKLDELEKSEKK